MNAILMPLVMRCNAPAVPGQKLEALRRASGLEPEGDITAALARMNLDLGIAESLASVGVTEAQFDWVVEWALADHSHPTSPPDLAAEDYRRLLEAALRPFALEQTSY